MVKIRYLALASALLFPVSHVIGAVYDESVIASYHVPFNWDMRMPTGTGGYFFNSSFVVDLSSQTLPVKRGKIINISVWIRNDAKNKLDNFTRLARLAHNGCVAQDYTSGGNTLVYYFDPSFRPGIRIHLNADLYGNPQTDSYFGQLFTQYDSPTEIRGYVKIDYLNN